MARTDSEIGLQPCSNLMVPLDEPGLSERMDLWCREWALMLALCENSGSGHQLGLSDSSTARPEAMEAARQETRAGLYDVRDRLRAVRTSAMNGNLPGVSRWIYGTTGELSQILGWLGMPVANTNSNSKGERSYRITNSNSKQGEEELTNTNYEEQAP